MSPGRNGAFWISDDQGASAEDEYGACYPAALVARTQDNRRPGHIPRRAHASTRAGPPLVRPVAPRDACEAGRCRMTRATVARRGLVPIDYAPRRDMDELIEPPRERPRYGPCAGPCRAGKTRPHRLARVTPGVWI